MFKGVFGLSNEVIHHITPSFFFWFVEWNELILLHKNPHNLTISATMKNDVIPVFHQNSWNKLMMHHLFLKPSTLKVCSTPNKKDDNVLVGH
jgi:hypothetical protein